jgi:hypothetical protein
MNWVMCGASDIIRITVKRSGLFGSREHGLPLTDFNFIEIKKQHVPTVRR